MISIATALFVCLFVVVCICIVVLFFLYLLFVELYSLFII